MRRLGAAVILAVLPMGGVHAEPPKPPVTVEASTFDEAWAWCGDHYWDPYAKFQSEAYMECANAAYRAFGYIEYYRKA